MTQNLPNMLKAYRGLTNLASPFVPLYLSARARKGKEDRARVSERYGKTNATRPSGELIWMHAASVGESVMLLPLIEHALKQRPSCQILLTSGTVTSAELMNTRLPKRAIHQYAPIDTPRAVKRFLDHWSPSLCIWAESEIWPNLILECKSRNLPMALINARLSKSSLERWGSSFKQAGESLFGAFSDILPADKQTAKGLSDITGQAIKAVGNLKYAGAPLGVDVSALASHRAVLSTRPVWCAASTHEGEDEIVLNAHQNILKTYPNAVLILVPRHPKRGSDVIRMLEASSLDYTHSAYAEDITDMTNVILIAAMGQLGLAYRLAAVSFIGGSLLSPLSGHNPLEPARLGSAILSGPNVASFEEIYAVLNTDKAARTIHNACDLSARVMELFGSPDAQKAQAETAAQIAKTQDTILNTVWDRLTPLLQKQGSAS